MSKVYVIADLHFGHSKLAQIRGFSSTAEHDHAIVDNWNRVVTKRDVVYVLGDVFRLDLLPALLGMKKLILGNHDRYPMRSYIPHFSKIAAMHEFDGCALTHIPVHPCQLHRYRKNIHGHMHTGKIDDPRYVCVSAEQIGMTPTLLQPLTVDV